MEGPAELFVEAVARVLAWADAHKAHLFLAAAVAAGLMAASAAMSLWGLIELGRLAYAAAGLPLFAGLAETGERAAERFRALAERYMRWRIGEEAVDEVLKAPLRGERPYAALLRLARSRRDLPPPLAELGKALDKVKGEAEKDAAVVAALALYRALVRSAEAYRGWAELYRWARGLAGRQEFIVTAGEVRRLRGAQKRLEEAAEEVRRELNGVLALYSRSDLYERLRPLLEVDWGKAEGLAEARRDELRRYSDANMGTKAYAALLSIAKGGIYGHAAVLLAEEGALADTVISTPRGAYKKAKDIAKGRGEAVDPSRSPKGAAGWEDRAASALLRYLLGRAVDEDLKFRRVEGASRCSRPTAESRLASMS